MALITTDDLADSLGVTEPRLTAEVARNEIHLKVGQQEEPHYLGWLPGVFGEVFPASQRALVQFYWEVGQGSSGDTIHVLLRENDDLPDHLRVSIANYQDTSESVNVTLSKPGAAWNFVGARARDYTGDMPSFTNIGSFPFVLNSTLELVFNGSPDGNQFSPYNILPAAATIPLNEISRELQDAVGAAADWVAARYTIPDPPTQAAISGELEMAKILFSEGRRNKGLASSELAEAQPGNLLLVQQLLEPYMTPALA